MGDSQVHHKHALLPLMYPDAVVVRDAVPLRAVQAYALTLQGHLPESLSMCFSKEYWSKWRAGAVAHDSALIVWPRASADACLVAAYVIQKCREVFLLQCWAGSRLSMMQREFPDRYPKQDFQFWVRYGSWSCCDYCGTYHFNDKYFREQVYQNLDIRAGSEALAAQRRSMPDDPVEHAAGAVGLSSRWWYLPGMYHPVADCGRCGKLPQKLVQQLQKHPGRAFSELLRQRADKYAAAKAKSEAGSGGQQALKTGELYRVPSARPVVLARACLRIPRYHGGVFKCSAASGEFIFDLSEAEWQALRIVVLRTDVKEERYGAAHHLNWKKTGLSRAYYVKDRLTDARMPTPRAKAAFAFLQTHNEYYKAFLRHHNFLLDGHKTLTLSSYDLFIVERGIECAMYPHLYPTTEFNDTGILETLFFR